MPASGIWMGMVSLTTKYVDSGRHEYYLCSDRVSLQSGGLNIFEDTTSCHVDM